jgi:hypothetical protein
VLFNGAFPEPRDICLLGLLEATKKFRRVVPAERVQEAIDQTRRYVDLDLVGRSLSTHVARMYECRGRQDAGSDHRPPGGGREAAQQGMVRHGWISPQASLLRAMRPSVGPH